MDIFGSVAILSGVSIDAAWHHVVVTSDVTATVGTMTFYIDGVFANSGAVDLDVDNSGHVLRIGGGVEGGAGSSFSGPIDDVRIYNRALSPAEVQQLYKLGTVRISQ